MSQPSPAFRSKPLVSAIVIFLNEEKFLREAIESVFTQTYDNWELLLVDDGSTDASTEIARRYAAQHPEKVSYLEHEGHQNRGMSASRNLGIRHAKAHYIAFLDADDVWLPQKVERQLAIMSSQPEAAMIYGSPLLWYAWTGRSVDTHRDSLQPITVEPNTLVRPPILLRLFLARQAISPCPSDVVLHRQIIEDVGGFEESFPGMYEDQAFFSKVALQAPIYVSGECWTKHRKHPDSNTSVWKRTGEYRSAQANLKFLDWIKEYLSRQGVKDPVISKAIRKRSWRYRHPVLHRLLRRVQNLLQQVKVLYMYVVTLI